MRRLRGSLAAREAEAATLTCLLPLTRSNFPVELSVPIREKLPALLMAKPEPLRPPGPEASALVLSEHLILAPDSLESSKSALEV